MSFRNKEHLDISFEEFEESCSPNIAGKRTHISELYDDFPHMQKLPASVQEFLAKSDQIQDDLRKFSENSQEKDNLLLQINERLKHLGYEIEILAKTKLEITLEILNEILNDFLYTSNKLEESERTLCEVSDSKKFQEKELRNRKVFKDFDYSSIDSSLEDLFKEVMNKNFSFRSETDHNIMSFIKYTEIQREKLIKKGQDLIVDNEKSLKSIRELEQKNSQLRIKLTKCQPSLEIDEKFKIIDQILLDLSLKSIKELPDAISKFQKVMYALPTVEKFITEITEEFADDHTCKKLEDIVAAIRTLKRQVVDLDDFRKRVNQAFGSEKVKDIVNFGRGISHFCKLFEVQSSEKMLPVVEELFYFVHQIKGFIAVRIM